MPRRDFSKVPFAATGDTNAIPDAVQPDGSISLPQGWGFDYQRDNGAGGGTPDPLAKNIDREDMNGILNEITASIGEVQQNGYPIWVATAAPYPLNAFARHNDIVWRNTVINNSAEPGVGGDNWVNSVFIAAGHGQCRLSVGSPTSLNLKPFNGNMVIVGGIPLQIPSAGISVSNAGLLASTLYYVYLSGTTAAPVLSLSVTGHSQAPNGVETKTGDVASTLVGIVYTNASTQFADSSSTRFCLNWFNRRKVISVAAQTGPFSFTNTTLAETSTTIRAQFLTWADDTPVVQLSAGFTETSGTPAITRLNFQIFMDGIASGYGPAVAHFVQPTYDVSISSHGALGGLSEGYHFATLGTYVGPNGGTLALTNVQNSVNLFG